MGDWNNSLTTLANAKAAQPPLFAYDPQQHSHPTIVMSDATELYTSGIPPLSRGNAEIKIASDKARNNQSEGSSTRCTGSSPTKARMIRTLGKISVFSKYKVVRQDSSDLGCSAAGQSKSVLPTTEVKMSSKEDDGSDIASPVESMPKQTHQAEIW